MRVALVCIAKNEDDYIQEWIDYNKKLGFDKIFIYENDWCCNINDEKVVKIKYNGQTKQMSSYNDFVVNYGKEYDWAAFFDVDEFLVLKQHNNIQEFINEYKESQSIAINWMLFGDNNHQTINNNDYSVINRFTKRDNSINPHIKTICNLSYSPFFYCPHNSNLSWVDTNNKIGSGSFNENGPTNVVQLNHYFTKTLPEFKNKISRGRSDNGSFRSIDDFDCHNHNKIDDYYAYNFFNNNKV